MSTRMELPMNSVVFSLPGSTGFRLIHQLDRGISAKAASEGGSFAFRSFSGSNGVAYIHGDVSKEVDARYLGVSLLERSAGNSPDKASYMKQVGLAKAQASAMGGKIVLSRPIEISSSLRPGESLVALREQFPDAFVYLLHTARDGTWMGATPEVLIEQQHGVYATMALAGTKWDDDLFEQKEFDEQMLVTRDIMERLSDTVIEVSDIREHPYGGLRHLRTDIRWEDERDAFTFAEKLHPTPAIAGYPRKEALAFIHANEGYDRGLYTGYLGWSDPNESSHLFVNLRCLQLFRDHAVFYAGGGVNADSVAEKEWEETERKKDSVVNVLVHE